MNLIGRYVGERARAGARATVSVWLLSVVFTFAFMSRYMQARVDTCLRVCAR